MDSYYLSEKADNRYKNKEARIIVNLESIQAESGEMKAIWGKNEKDLGITYQPCTCEVVTSVIFDKIINADHWRRENRSVCKF